MSATIRTLSLPLCVYLPLAGLLFQSHGLDFGPEAFAEVLFVYPTIRQSPGQIEVLATVCTSLPCHVALHAKRVPVISILELTHFTRCCMKNE